MLDEKLTMLGRMGYIHGCLRHGDESPAGWAVCQPDIDAFDRRELFTGNNNAGIDGSNGSSRAPLVALAPKGDKVARDVRPHEVEDGEVRRLPRRQAPVAHRE